MTIRPRGSLRQLSARDRVVQNLPGVQEGVRVDDGELYQTLRLAKKLAVIVTAHCENAELVSEVQKSFIGEGKDGARMA